MSGSMSKGKGSLTIQRDFWQSRLEMDFMAAAYEILAPVFRGKLSQKWEYASREDKGVVEAEKTYGVGA